MFIVISHSRGVVGVLDTEDGVVERISLSKVRDYISKGVPIIGVSVRPEFGDGQDMFLNFEYSRKVLISCGINPSKYGL